MNGGDKGMALEVGITARTHFALGGIAGLGYYLERSWTRVRDELKATAIVACQDGRSVALVAADLMYADAEFTRLVREQVARHTDIPPEAVCVSVSHSHSAPTAGFARGVGDQDLEYLALARRQVATAVICAWRQRRPATLWAGRTTLEGMTFNRTRQGGDVDSQAVCCAPKPMAGPLPRWSISRPPHRHDVYGPARGEPRLS
jgi:hypothetical protein